MKLKKEQILHIVIIIIGTIFLLIPAFHSNVWFDESYSVAMSKHDFFDIWKIGSNDVHPIIYYWVLHIIKIIFGYNILAYRLFSVVCIVILSILGYTHIRKDFGEKIGMIFSFLVLFLPINLVYATEIRMYSMAMLCVTVAAIYAYRITKQGTIKNWCIFAVFSIISCYTHYYGLATAGIINIMLLIFIIINIVKDKKKGLIKKETKNNIICFIISGAAQVLLYLPWVIELFKQMSSVSKGFWISVNDKTFIEIIKFQFTGNLGDTEYINGIIAFTFAIAFLIYAVAVIIIKIKKKEETKPALLSIAIYLIVVGVIALISIKMPILYPRYLLNMTGLFIFFLSYIMKNGNKYINYIIIALIIIMNIYVNVNLASVNYDKINNEPIEYIKENIKSDDIIIYCNENNYDFGGFIVSVNFPEYKQYFYDIENWNVEKAYSAYGPCMKTIYNLDELKEYKGRIWVIECVDYHLVEEYLLKEFEDINIQEQKQFVTKYKNLRYSISLINKD